MQPALQVRSETKSGRDWSSTPRHNRRLHFRYEPGQSIDKIVLVDLISKYLFTFDPPDNKMVQDISGV